MIRLTLVGLLLAVTMANDPGTTTSRWDGWWNVQEEWNRSFDGDVVCDTEESCREYYFNIFRQMQEAENRRRGYLETTTTPWLRPPATTTRWVYPQITTRRRVNNDDSSSSSSSSSSEERRKRKRRSIVNDDTSKSIDNDVDSFNSEEEAKSVETKRDKNVKYLSKRSLTSYPADWKYGSYNPYHSYPLWMEYARRGKAWWDSVGRRDFEHWIYPLKRGESRRKYNRKIDTRTPGKIIHE